MLKKGYLEVAGWINFVATFVIGLIVRVLYKLGVVDRYMDYAGRGLMQYGFIVFLITTIVTAIYDNFEHFHSKRKLSKK